MQITKVMIVGRAMNVVHSLQLISRVHAEGQAAYFTPSELADRPRVPRRRESAIQDYWTWKSDRIITA